MTTPQTAEDAGCARYTFRLRVSSTDHRALMAEWDRCRWIWNECVAKSKAVHLHHKTTREKTTCGPAQLDKMPAGAEGVRLGGTPSRQVA
ncbi:hypothetical protein GCM10020367_21460 [Streptomyces sannanensis]|uniref:Transposase putative helix-turn-helix domain-containing protein n=1 Tax=Streptomyces sannanensis TaxID=285536 RepID=A0ABP6S9B7_9ACTN